MIFLIPLAAFFVLLAAGLWMGELGGIRALVFLAIWIAARIAYSYLGLPWAAFIVVEVVLDITLILMIFGRDLRY